jgi:hypothetical protein
MNLWYITLYAALFVAFMSTWMLINRVIKLIVAVYKNKDFRLLSIYPLAVCLIWPLVIILFMVVK